jgi:CRP/FNR family transcriptional regulator, cyclic AMP receptor protein
MLPGMGTTQTQSVERTLRAFALLEGIPEAELKTLEARCRWRSYDKGQTVLDKGATSKDVFFVLRGSVAVVTFSPSGKEVTLATVKPSESFGELAAIDDQPRSASVTAIEKSELCIMPPEVFMDLVRTNALVSFRLLQRMARMVRQSGLRIMELSTLQAAQRVYAELLRMAQPEAAVPGLWVVRPLPPMHEIAGITSTTRETVNRAVSQLYPSGLLKRKGRNLYLMDKGKLEELVQTIQAHHSHK